MSDTKQLASATINGENRVFLCEPRQSLLEILRDELFLTGTKEGCNDGNCGSCNVILNDVLVNSCCVFGVEVDGSQIETIEGLSDGNDLHPLQRTFLEDTGIDNFDVVEEDSFFFDACASGRHGSRCYSAYVSMMCSAGDRED